MLHGIQREPQQDHARSERETHPEQNQRPVQRPQPQRRQDRLTGEHAAEQKPKCDGGQAARNQQRRGGKAPAQCQAGDDEYRALTHIGKHVAEHERGDEGEHLTRVRLARARHPEQPREQFERLRPARIAQHDGPDHPLRSVREAQ